MRLVGLCRRPGIGLKTLRFGTKLKHALRTGDDMKTKRPEPLRATELSRPVAVADLAPDDETELEVIADEAERQALARRFSLLELRRLEAKIGMRRSDALVRVRVSVSAEVVQNCVVTLEPVTSEVRESAEISFAPPTRDAARRGSVWVDAEGDDPPEPLVGATVDVGEIVAEQLGLGLDPYPRRPGATFESPPESLASAAGHPFAQLRRLGG
jgi:hypothetical protein